MSARFTYTCPNCGFSVDVWDEGHPFIKDDKGKRHYFYHPGEVDVIMSVASGCSFAVGKPPSEIMTLAASRIGHLQDGICLDCGKAFRALSAEASKRCRACKSGNTVWLMELEGKPCPKCKAAHFSKGVFSAIS